MTKQSDVQNGAENRREFLALVSKCGERRWPCLADLGLHGRGTDKGGDEARLCHC